MKMIQALPVAERHILAVRNKMFRTASEVAIGAGLPGVTSLATNIITKKQKLAFDELLTIISGLTTKYSTSTYILHSLSRFLT
jgi:hypothetical protein